MITSPPSATTGSLLYVPFAAVQKSSYIAGMIASTRSYGSSTQTMWRRDESIAACRHASCTSPQNMPATPWCVTTSASSESGVSSSAAARSITARTAVSIVPITSYDVIERAEPVGEVNDLGRRDSREQVLRAAGEAGDLVRKHRAADEHVVVFGRQAIERDRHVLAQTARR